MRLLTNNEATKIVKKNLSDAKDMLGQIMEKHAQGAFRHVDVHCNVAMSMIDEYLDLDHPETVENYFRFRERILAFLDHIQDDIKDNSVHLSDHINGLRNELNNLIQETSDH